MHHGPMASVSAFTCYGNKVTQGDSLLSRSLNTSAWYRQAHEAKLSHMVIQIRVRKEVVNQKIYIQSHRHVTNLENTDSHFPAK